MGVKRPRGAIRRFLADIGGVSAVEFALIAPVMILLYCGMAELSSAMMAARKTSHAISTGGDLVAQTNSVSASDMANLFQASIDIMAPFPTTKPSGSSNVDILQVRTSSVSVRSDNSIQVDWSCTPIGQPSLQPLAKNAVLVAAPGTKGGATDPSLTALLTTTSGASDPPTPGASVIMAEGQYAFTSPADYVLPNGLNLSNTFYFKPRKSASVASPGTATSNTSGGSATCNG